MTPLILLCFIIQKGIILKNKHRAFKLKFLKNSLKSVTEKLFAFRNAYLYPQ